MVATACTLVASIVGKATRDGKLCYYIDDGVYHTFSGVIFDHCKYPVKALHEAARQHPALCARLRPHLRRTRHHFACRGTAINLDLGDLVYSPNIGAYSQASSTWFNGFPPAKVVHVNQ